MAKPVEKILSLAWKNSGRTRQSGELLELEILAVKGLQDKQRLSIQFVDWLPLSKKRELDSFDVTLLKSGDKWLFTDLVDSRDDGHPGKMKLATLTDHVKVKLPGITDPLDVIFIPDPDANESSIHQIGVEFLEGNKQIDSLLMLQSIMSTSPYQAVGMGGMLNYYASRIPLEPVIQDVIHENDSYWKQLNRERERRLESQTKRLKEYVEEVLKDPDSPFLVDLKRMQEYRQLSAEIIDIQKLYDSTHPASDGFGHIEYKYNELQNKLRIIEEEHNQYLDISKGIPKSYVEQAKAAKKHKERCAEIDAIADSPLCMAICCLPLGGLVEGGLQILKGNYWQGILSAGLDVVTFGSFQKISAAQRVYKGLQKCSKAVRGQLFEARYIHILMEVGEQRAMSLKGLNQLVGGFSAKAGTFGSTLLDLRGFVGSLHDLKTLLGNKDVFRASLELAKTPGYKDWLTQALKTNEQLLVWGCLRSLANSYKLYDDVKNLSDPERKGEVIRGHMQEDLRQLRGLFADSQHQEWDGLAEIIKGIGNVEGTFFVDSVNGLLYNGEDDGRDLHREWLSYVETARKNEHRERRGNLHKKDATDLRKDMDQIETLWKQREQEYQNFCKDNKQDPKRDASREKFAVQQAMLSLYGTRELEKAVANFLEYFENLVKLCLPDTDARSGSMPRFWILMSNYVQAASGAKVSIVKNIYVDNFRGSCEDHIQVLYGE